MITVFKGVESSHVLVFDAEYNEGALIQFAGILFRKIEKNMFQIERSLNVYVKLENQRINNFIKNFTGITDSFLDTFGEDLRTARRMIEELVTTDGDLIVVSHGISNDRQTLIDNGIDLYVNQHCKPIEGICTYNAARRLLGRNKRLSLLDIAEDSGVFLSSGHNAFDDAWATVSAFCLLSKLEEERKNEKILHTKV